MTRPPIKVWEEHTLLKEVATHVLGLLSRSTKVLKDSGENFNMGYVLIQLCFHCLYISLTTRELWISNNNWKAWWVFYLLVFAGLWCSVSQQWGGVRASTTPCPDDGLSDLSRLSRTSSAPNVQLPWPQWRPVASQYPLPFSQSRGSNPRGHLRKSFSVCKYRTNKI